jgi:hypothetical protein
VAVGEQGVMEQIDCPFLHFLRRKATPHSGPEWMHLTTMVRQFDSAAPGNWQEGATSRTTVAGICRKYQSAERHWARPHYTEHRKALTSRYTVVTEVLNLGADLGALDKNGSTPPHLAISEANLWVVPLLLENGARSIGRTPEGESSFQVASARGLGELIGLL